MFSAFTTIETIGLIGILGTLVGALATALTVTQHPRLKAAAISVLSVCVALFAWLVIKAASPQGPNAVIEQERLKAIREEAAKEAARRIEEQRVLEKQELEAARLRAETLAALEQAALKEAQKAIIGTWTNSSLFGNDMTFNPDGTLSNFLTSRYRYHFVDSTHVATVNLVGITYVYEVHLTGQDQYLKVPPFDSVYRKKP